MACLASLFFLFTDFITEGIFCMNNYHDSKSAVKKFFEANKSLAYLLPVLGVLIIVLIIVLTSLNNKGINTSGKDGSGLSDNVPEGPQVEVLPQLKREESSPNVDKDPFEEPMRLAGIVESNNKPAAIIVADGYSYIVGIEDTVGEKSWKVVSIERDAVTLESAEGNITLELSSNK